MITVESINKKIGFDFRQLGKLMDDWMNDCLKKGLGIPEEDPFSYAPLSIEELDFIEDYLKKYPEKCC